MAAPVDAPDNDLLGELTAFRRDLHAHPELGFQETRTAARVAAALRAQGVDVTEGIGGTGLVGTIRGPGPAPDASACGPTWTRCPSARRPASPTRRARPA